MARHLQDNHSNYTAVETSDVQEEECGSPKPDFKFNYHQNKLAFGLLLLDFNDAVREGDGEHLLDLYKLTLCFITVKAILSMHILFYFTWLKL